MIQFNIFYSCSNPITNEIMKLKNKSIKLGIIFSIINLCLEVFFFLVNIPFILYDIVKDSDCIKKSYYSGNFNSYTNKNDIKKRKRNIPPKIKPGDGIQEKPVGEVKLSNDMRTQENQLNQTMNNNHNFNQNIDLEVFQKAVPGTTSKENI